MVHSTTPGAFRPAPPRDIYARKIRDPQPEIHTPAVVGISHRAREEAGPIASMFFVPAPRPPASDLG